MASTCPNGHTSTADDYCDVCGAPIEAAQQGGAPAPAASAAPAGSAAAASAGTPGLGLTNGGTAGVTAGPVACPHCGTENVAEALFCEACGYDFTTGTLPRSDAESPVDGATDQPEGGGDAAAGAGTSDAAPTGSEAAQTAVSQGVGDAGADNFSSVAEVWIDPAWYEAQQSPDPLPSPGLPEVVPLRKQSLLIGRVSRSRNIHPDIDCEPDSGASRRQAQLTTDGTRWWVEDLESANGTFIAGGSDPLPDNPIPVGAKREIQPDDRIYVGAWTRIVVRPATAEEQESLV